MSKLFAEKGLLNIKNQRTLSYIRYDDNDRYVLNDGYSKNNISFTVENDRVYIHRAKRKPALLKEREEQFVLSHINQYRMIYNLPPLTLHKEKED